MRIFTPEHHILKYLAKWEIMQNDPRWLANPHVQRVLVNGKPDKEKVKELFIERGICTAEEFEQGLSKNEDTHLDKQNFRCKPEGVVRFSQMNVAIEHDLQVLEENAKKRPEGQRQLTQEDLDTLKHKEY